MFDFTLAFYKEVRMMKEAFWTVILQKGTSYVVVTFYLLFIGEMLNYTEQDTSLTHPLLSDAHTVCVTMISIFTQIWLMQTERLLLL